MIKEIFLKKSNANEPEGQETVNGPEAKKSAGEAEAQQAAPALRDPVEAAYCLGAGIDDETLAKAKEIIAVIAEGHASGAFNPEALRLAVRLLNYEQSVKEARADGYRSGKADSIAEAFRDKRARAREAAEIPHLTGARNIGTAKEENIFNVARGVK